MLIILLLILGILSISIKFTALVQLKYSYNIINNWQLLNNNNNIILTLRDKLKVFVRLLFNLKFTLLFISYSADTNTNSR